MSRATARKCPAGTAAGSPNKVVKKVADSCLFLAATIVWLKEMVTVDPFGICHEPTMRLWPASMPDAVRHRHATHCTAKHFERSVRKGCR